MGNTSGTFNEDNKAMGGQCSKDVVENRPRPTYRESVLDITGKPLAAGQASQANNKMRTKNIFAAPVKIITNYVFPVYEKSDSDKVFIQKAIEDNFIFAGVEHVEFANLINAFQIFSASDGEKIITEGEVGDYFYILQEGSVAFTVGGTKVGTAEKGSSFGDLALLYDCPRAATCTAVGDCKLWRVDQGAFRQILANSTLNKDKAILDTLKKVHFLKDLEIEYLNKIAHSVETKKFAAGTQIIKKGDVGLEFFVIKSGQALVHDIEVGGRKYDDQELKAGDYFGERAIVKEEPRVANITAKNDITTLTLSREKFLEVVGPLEELMKRTNDLMVLKGIPAFSRSDVKELEYKALSARIVYKNVASGTSFYKKGDAEGSGIYFVHSGKVLMGETDISNGGYFGVLDTLFSETCKGDAAAVEDCLVGYLSKDTIVNVIIDIARVEEGSKCKSLRIASSISDAIPLDKLKRHRILGVGTFGKVWLVTNGDSKDAYALKIQQKRVLIEHQQVEGVIREMNVMTRLNHPFVLKLVNVYQNSEQILMLVKLIQGGELYGVMKRATRNILPENDAKFYASGILEGLSYMHSNQILYRDLKPENVLINKDGYPIIVDLGFAKHVPDKTFTLCGTPWYIAPEVILGRGHDKACDHWSWAILVHEMVTSKTPFVSYGSDQMTLFKAIVRGTYTISKRCTPEISDLVRRILVTKPSNRLGSLAGGDQDIKQHPWLAPVSFDKLRLKKFRSPWKPTINDSTDVSDFDNWDHMAKDEELLPVTKLEQDQFMEVDEISKKLSA